MKKIIVLLAVMLLWNAGNVWGQTISSEDKKNNMYVLLITDYSHKVVVDDGICEAFTEITAKNDSKSTLFSRNETSKGKNGLKNTTKTDSVLTYLINFKPTSFSLQIYAKDSDYDLFNSNDCDSGNGIVISDNTVSLSVNYCTLNSFSGNYPKTKKVGLFDSDNGVQTNEVKFNYQLIPLHTLAAPSDGNGDNYPYLPTDDKVTLSAKTEFDASLYRYQYCIEDGDWKNISSNLYEADKLTLSAKDLFGDGYVQHLKKNIGFRVVSCNPSVENYSASNTVTLRLIPSAPHIISENDTPPTCHSGDDGKITLTFSRQLYDGESLYFGFREDPNDNATIKQGDSKITFFNNVNGKYTKTIEGLESKTHHIRLYGVYRYGEVLKDTINTYTDGARHSVTVTVRDQPALSLDEGVISPVNCMNGKDGRITVKMSGGTGVFNARLTQNGWIVGTSGNFTSTYTFERLKKGTYTFTVEDSNGCIYDIAGNEITKNFSVGEPLDSVLISGEEIVQEPTFFGGANGWAKKMYTGGSRLHTAIWKHTTTNATYANTIEEGSGEDTTIVQNLSAGVYKLEVRDSKYASAYALNASEENICGCYDTISITVTEPPLLEVAVSEYHYVTCNGDSDGELMASAIGGRPLETGGLPYKYEWYRYDSPTDLVYLNQPDSIATGLISGTYKVKISDKYGTFVWSEDFELVQPEQLIVDVEVLQNIECDGETTGRLKATATGGTPPYTFLWDTNETTDVIENLSQGNYVVAVRDARYAENIEGHYCLSEAVGTITSPNPIKLNAQVHELLCNDAADGEIVLNVTGGVPPYSYLWEDGSTGDLRANLVSGIYSVTVTDDKGCFNSEEFTLINPEPIIVNLGNDITLCKNQSVVIDGSVDVPGLSYRWTDENNQILSDQPAMTIDKAGKYRLLVTSQHNCVGEDEIVISQSDDEVLTDFVIPPTVARNIPFYAVNITQTPVDRFEWVFPDNAVVLSENDDRTQLSFDTNGTYSVGLTGGKGFCGVTVYKSVQVVDRIQEDNSEEAFLKRFTVQPNPSNGTFEAIIELREQGDYQLYLYDSFGKLVDTKEVRNSIVEVTNYNLPNIQQGVYLLRFVSAETVSIVRIIIQ